jgi:hypothetical protein
VGGCELIWRLESGGRGRLEGPEILGEVERVEGIEPSTKAWEAFVLPLNYTRLILFFMHLAQGPNKNPRYQLGKLE